MMQQLRKIDGIIRRAYEPAILESKSRLLKWSDLNNSLPHNKATIPYTVCLPPPNVTGSLHLGHALTVTIEDALIRWHVKRGRSAVWIPGCDHASIATQVAVERHLAQIQNLSRLTVGREKFISHVMDWKNNRESEIKNQLEKMGAMLDWKRYRFTMDQDYSNAVTEAFCRLHKSGLIYRKRSFVNWCPHLKSTVSDIEVDSVEIDGPTELSLPSHPNGKVTFGKLYTVRYNLEEGGGFVTVSTTRPETVLGDVALAVHPSDSRYLSLIGKYVLHPLFPDRRLPVVSDIGVDPEFGTGVVKVTPAHDELDFDIWQRAKMSQDYIVDVFDDAAFIRPGFGEFSGLSRYVARGKILHRLGEAGLLDSVAAHKQILPVCSRSGEVVEPRLRYQWFVACKGRLVERALRAAETGEITFVSDFYKNIWLHWLTNIKDWCISRQLWWGHRVPAYRVAGSNESTSQWIVARFPEEAKQIGNLDEHVILEQDEDVLDTWFSSGIYPLASLGWPQNTPDLKNRYPLSIMETGADILFFWVARMVMLCSELAPVKGQLPFNTVLLHGIVRDATGKKMSKSLGNVIDPVDAIHGATLQTLQSRFSKASDTVLKAAQAKLFPKGIPECGADGLRMALCLYDTHATDISIDVSHMAASRRFGNKLWQAVRFVLMHTPPDYRHNIKNAGNIKLSIDSDGLVDHPMDAWLLGKLSSMMRNCHVAFSDEPMSVVQSATNKPITLPPLRIHAAATAVKNFIHHDLCDTYIEYVKADLKGSDDARSRIVFDILYLALLTSFDYLHPFMPFITEELSQVVRQEVKLPPVDTVLQLPIEGFAESRIKHWEEAQGNVDDALNCVYAARSAMSLVANALNQRKTPKNLTKPVYFVYVALNNNTAKTTAFSTVVSRLLRSVEISTTSHDDNSSIVNVQLDKTDQIFLQMPTFAGQLLYQELLRRSVKADESKDGKDKLFLTPIDELHCRWLVALKANGRPSRCYGSNSL